MVDPLWCRVTLSSPAHEGFLPGYLHIGKAATQPVSARHARYADSLPEHADPAIWAHDSLTSVKRVHKLLQCTESHGLGANRRDCRTRRLHAGTGPYGLDWGGIFLPAPRDADSVFHELAT
ncbi:predicted protein [Plenodomus lingam JN3]|uniref:Predicted protein n=1 Tax=Leptosphaeria maculans (strain JN3 / isolate v23.1.3 / race Av1-4-5-6-7-8) TaxID=985895 RepID=E4ZYK1_LEPMJ|nr:predicted protein [Plenodomus lingam JN3]CBX96527.1 predicted protein [Plenodomus lingam JN3]